MLLPNLAVLATLLTIITATPTPPEKKSADNGTFEALVKYEVTCRSGGPTTPNAPTAPRSESPGPDASFTPHEDFDVDIIWHNMDIRSDFRSIRKSSRGPIGRILVDFAKVLESELFEVISVNASKHLFCVVVACQKNMNEGVDDLLWLVL
ncbi:uncharacterized protein J4E78_006295 [Alternaria triticimaculans]|uniref:uncharacterized protein n=1 Tax=Alternaria triticimaculans TaxID=297637 RepID=UPI0020C29424|nr:uncharacterized protein J4E78_006295 [Alternaria triticimaculans]KAI4657906.1 hypothetical protein J4E78_006295 [Alternaria triticimaculans]